MSGCCTPLAIASVRRACCKFLSVQNYPTLHLCRCYPPRTQPVMQLVFRKSCCPGRLGHSASETVQLKGLLTRHAIRCGLENVAFNLTRTSLTSWAATPRLAETGAQSTERAFLIHSARKLCSRLNLYLCMSDSGLGGNGFSRCMFEDIHRAPMRDAQL